MEAALLQSETLYRTLVENAFDAIEIRMLNNGEDGTERIGGKLISKNKKMNELFERTDEEIEKLTDLVDISPPVQSNGQPSLKTNESYSR